MSVILKSVKPRFHSGSMYSPIGSWDFTNVTSTTVPDTSGNGRDLTSTFVTSTQNPSYIGGFPSPDALQYTNSNAIWRITGNISVSLVANPQSAPTDGFMVGCITGASGTTANNCLWSMGLDSSSRLRYFSESGLGVNYELNNIALALAATYKFSGWSHFMMTRAGGTAVKLYLDGALLASTLSATTPTGGTSSILKVQNGDRTEAAGAGKAYGSLAIYNSTLTDSQVAYLARYLLGR